MVAGPLRPYPTTKAPHGMQDGVSLPSPRSTVFLRFAVFARRNSGLCATQGNGLMAGRGVISAIATDASGKRLPTAVFL